MSATGCHIPCCVWKQGERVGYCIDCGRYGACTCHAMHHPNPSMRGYGPVVTRLRPGCPEHDPPGLPSTTDGDAA